MKQTNQEQRGFTVMEVLVALGLLAVLFAFTAPIVANNYRRYQLTSEKQQVVTLLQKAREEAMSNVASRSHGFSVQSSTYVIFAGTSYAMRDFSMDQIYPRNTAISVTGTTEFVFSALVGTPVSSSLYLNDPPLIASISINGEGRIDYD